MNDTRTPAERYAAWLDAVNRAARKGWQCVDGWTFRAPSGSLHDLSASDLTKLDLIEARGLSLVSP